MLYGRLGDVTGGALEPLYWGWVVVPVGDEPCVGVTKHRRWFCRAGRRSANRARVLGVGRSPTFWVCLDLSDGKRVHRWLFQRGSDSDFTVDLTRRLFPVSFIYSKTWRCRGMWCGMVPRWLLCSSGLFFVRWV